MKTIPIPPAAGRKRPPRATADLGEFSIEYASEAIFWVDEDARLVYGNRAACRSLGYSREQLLSLTVSDIDPNIRPGTWSSHWAKVKARGCLSFESSHRRRTGEDFPVEISAFHIGFAGEEYHVCFVHGLAERKNAEKMLRDALRGAESAEARLRSVVETANEAIITADEEGRITGWNSGAKAIFGYSASEAVGRPLTVLMPERYREQHQAGFERVLLTGESRSIGKQMELAGVTKDGREFPLELSLASWRCEGKCFFTGIARDITERKRAELALAEQARLALLRAEVAAVFSERICLHDILKRCSEAVVHHLDAAFARIWLTDESARFLELKASAGMYTHLDGAHSRLELGVYKYKIGLIAESRQPHLTNSAGGDPHIHDQEWVRREGMVAFAGYPLIVEGKVIGVFAMFARHPLSQAAFDALGWVAEGIAQGVERKRGEEQIRKQQEAIRQLSTPVLQLRDGLLILPVIGVIDPERARHLTDQLLENIRVHRATAVVLDITGVASVDRRVANHLVQTAQACRLLGAHVILTGVSLGISRTLAESGIDLTGLRTLGDLQSGIEEAAALLPAACVRTKSAVA